MAFAYCPDCGARIYLGRKPWLGQPAMCDQCEADLEVIRVNPPALDWVDNVQDDVVLEEEDYLVDSDFVISA
jgi:lysine biosynthesis protein LysW